MSAQPKGGAEPPRNALAIDELARSIDAFRKSLADLRPSMLDDADPASHEGRARRIYQSRRSRAQLFPGSDDLFGEPAWDMMIDLFIAGEQGKQITMTDAATGACVSPTVAQRWVTTMETRGLVERYTDPQDRRRILVRLTDSATAGMRAYLESV